MSIWFAESIETQPSVTLVRWRIIETSQQRYFVGYSVEERAGRVSTPIQSFDPKTRRGVIRSGRVYEVVGVPGVDAHADFVLAYWSNMKKLSPADITDISDQMELSQ